MKKTDWLEKLEVHVRDLEGIVAKFNFDSQAQWIIARRDKDIDTLENILQETWEKAPDKPWIHEIRGWGVLCDLCSEFIFGDLE